MQTNNDQSPLSISTLFRAARDGDLDTINYLLNSGINVNDITYNRRTALHYAAENNNFRIVDLLINSGVDIAIIDSSGRTARDLLPDHGL